MVKTALANVAEPLPHHAVLLPSSGQLLLLMSIDSHITIFPKKCPQNLTSLVEGRYTFPVSVNQSGGLTQRIRG